MITLQTCFSKLGALLVSMHTLVACLMQQLHDASNMLLTAEVQEGAYFAKFACRVPGAQSWSG